MTSIDIRKIGGEGIVTDDDLKDFNASEQRLLRAMATGEWFSALQIRAIANGSEGLRRMRALRPLLARHGLIIERESRGNRLFYYRITTPESDGE